MIVATIEIFMHTMSQLYVLFMSRTRFRVKGQFGTQPLGQFGQMVECSFKN